MTQAVDPDARAALIAELRATQLPDRRRRARLRLDAGLSLRQAVKKLALLGLDVTPETLRRWEAGAQPRPDHATVYREFLDALEEAGA